MEHRAVHQSAPALLAVITCVMLAAGCTDEGVNDAVPSGTTSTTGAPFFHDVPDGRAEPASTILVQVHLLDTSADPPRPLGVERQVPAVEAARNAALALMAGPTPAEAERGLVLPSGGITGVTAVRVVDGVASVRLVGACDRADGPVHIGELLVATLRSVPGVLAVKVLAPDGSTREPEGAVDSLPACLEAPAG